MKKCYLYVERRKHLGKHKIGASKGVDDSLLFPVLDKFDLYYESNAVCLWMSMRTTMKWRRLGGGMMTFTSWTKRTTGWSEGVPGESIAWGKP